MPGISGKQLAGDLINFVFGSFRSQIKAGTLTANRSITLPDGSGTLSVLLVHAQQNTASTLTPGIHTQIPFPTEVVDGSNLFASGFFTPSTTALHRVSCNLYFTVASGTIGDYAAAVFQGGTIVATIFFDACSNAAVLDSGHAMVQLTAGTAYNIRGYCTGASPTIAIGPGVINTLSIELMK